MVMVNLRKSYADVVRDNVKNLNNLTGKALCKGHLLNSDAHFLILLACRPILLRLLSNGGRSHTVSPTVQYAGHAERPDEAVHVHAVLQLHDSHLPMHLGWAQPLALLPAPECAPAVSASVRGQVLAGEGTGSRHLSRPLQDGPVLHCRRSASAARPAAGRASGHCQFHQRTHSLDCHPINYIPFD